MPWQCFVVQRISKTASKNGHTYTHVFKDLHGKEYIGEDSLPVGAMWIGDDSHVWGVKIPGECGLNRFCPSLEYNGHHWKLIGEAPNITVTPSINHIGVWHGSITNGVISDDLEGKKFNLTGLRIT